MRTTLPLRSPTAGTVAFICLLMTAACVPATGSGMSQGPSVGEVVAIALALNEGEVQTNEVAMERATRSDVRQFARRMVTDHTAALDQMRGAGLSPVENAYSRQLAENARQTVSALRQYEGAAFDAAHMRSQVELHEHALRTIDEFLLPAARGSRLRTLLEANRSMVRSHLEQARQIRAESER